MRPGEAHHPASGAGSGGSDYRRDGLTKVMRPVRGLFQAACVLCFFVMVTSITVQVIGRYVLPFPIADAVEISSFAQVWLVCLGAGLAVRHQALFTVDLFADRMPRGLARVRAAAVVIFGFVFLAALFKGSLALVAFGHFQVAPTLQIPMWTIYAAMPVGFVYFFIELVYAAFDPPRPFGHRDGAA